MEYQTFVAVLRAALSRETGIDIGKIKFEEKGGTFSERGDRLLIEFAEDEDNTEICALYAEELYHFYQEGSSLKELVDEIGSELNLAKKSQAYRRAKELTDYEKMRGDLFVRPFNEEKHSRLLEDAVYRTVGDIALVVYARMEESEEGISSTKIPRSLVKLWNKEYDEIFKEALLNTYFISPPRIYRWEELIFDPDYAGENFMDMVSEHTLVKASIGNCLSTSRKINGAVAIFLPGVAERLYDLLNSDFYIVFTSIHEAMIHNVATAQEKELAEILNHIVKEVTPKEEFLSSHVYRYCHESRRFSCLS